MESSEERICPQLGVNVPHYTVHLTATAETPLCIEILYPRTSYKPLMVVRQPPTNNPKLSNNEYSAKVLNVSKAVSRSSIHNPSSELAQKRVWQSTFLLNTCNFPPFGE